MFVQMIVVERRSSSCRHSVLPSQDVSSVGGRSWWNAEYCVSHWLGSPHTRFAGLFAKLLLYLSCSSTLPRFAGASHAIKQTPSSEDLRQKVHNQTNWEGIIRLSPREVCGKPKIAHPLEPHPLPLAKRAYFRGCKLTGRGMRHKIQSNSLRRLSQRLGSVSRLDALEGNHLCDEHFRTSCHCKTLHINDILSAISLLCNHKAQPLWLLRFNA